MAAVAVATLVFICCHKLFLFHIFILPFDDKVSISPDILRAAFSYKIVFHNYFVQIRCRFHKHFTGDFLYVSVFAAFLKLQFNFVIFWCKDIGAQAPPKMLVTLIPGLRFVISWWKEIGSKAVHKMLVKFTKKWRRQQHFFLPQKGKSLKQSHRLPWVQWITRWWGKIASPQQHTSWTITRHWCCRW